jgi:hypothetical protein
MKRCQVYGHSCGGAVDILQGRPVGAVRISFGLANDEADVTAWLAFLKSYYLVLESPQRPVSNDSFAADISVSEICIVRFYVQAFRTLAHLNAFSSRSNPAARSVFLNGP